MNSLADGTGLAPPIVSRLVAGLYEFLLLAGLLLSAGFLLVPLGNAAGLSGETAQAYTRTWAGVVISLYFLWFWSHGGQTLPMKTWRMRLVNADGNPLLPMQAVLRLTLVYAGWGLLGAHFLWALFDRDRQFLHDRIAGSRIIQLP